jgi:hypothetical protein
MSCYEPVLFHPLRILNRFVFLVPPSTREINHHTGQPFVTKEPIAKSHPKGKPVHGREFNPNEIDQLQMFVLNHSNPTEPPVYWQFPEVVSIRLNTSVPVMNIQRLL